MNRPTACEVAHVPVEVMNQNLHESSVLTGLSPQESALDEGVYVFPASLEQIRYWTLDQLDGDSTASNMAIAARLEGVVADHVVERALHAIVERHEALRTTFRMVDDRLCQIISEEARYSFTVTDFRNLPEAERMAASDAAIEEHSHARASLATGPAFFARLIHISDTLHFLAFTMHHIVCDGWSNGILIRDFTDFYAAFADYREPNLADLPFQFADFTVWQQNWLESDAAKAAIDYWRTHIRREMPAVDLPADRPRLPQKSYPGHIESTLLSNDLTTRLKAYCRAHNATMHQVMLAAFEGLIARYANQNEFLLGSTIANRTQPGMENVVGRFANPQVILADVTGDPSYSELLRRVSNWSAESYAHQDLPFSRLMEEFQLDQAGATSQFLQVYFVYQKAFMQPQEAGSLKVTPRPSVSGGVNFDLLVSIVERAEGPRLQMEYNTVLFRPERIQNLIAMYVRVLEAVMNDDSLKVSALPLVPQSEQRGVAVPESSLNTVAESRAVDDAPAATGPSLPQWLDLHAGAHGNSTAILDGNDHVSWNELRERSRTIASSLIALGLQPGQTVVLRLEYGAMDAATAWALLSTGAVVLPVSSACNSAEWARVVARHQPVFSIASATFAAGHHNVTSFESLLSDSVAAAEALPAQSGSSAAWLGLLDDTDGQLNALQSTHGATLHQLQSAASALDMRVGDTALVSQANSATDAWVDLLLPLTAGATLLYLTRTAPQDLQSMLEKHQVSFVFTAVPEALMALHHNWQGDRRLNVVVRGGLLSLSQIQRISKVPLRLWSLISSAQTAGPIAIAKAVGDELPAFTGLGGRRLIVLDDNDQAVPAGVPGELAVLGQTVRRGTDKAQATRTGFLARFSPSLNIGEEQHSARNYTEGELQIVDLVRRTVRLHGYRMRLGELEDLLWQDPDVAETVAAILPFEGVSTLVAYFRPFDLPHSAVQAESIRGIRTRFHAIAPGHVTAAELIPVDSIPRRADGSADFTLLPAPGTIKPAETTTGEYVPPRDELESSLVAIWEEVLGVRPIGIRTRFFDLGGYSLMIVRLFARINKTLGTSLPITTIFNAPTVEQLADIVRGRAYYSSLVPVQPQGTKPPFFMIHSYLLYQGIPNVMGPDYPFYGLRELDTDAEDMTVEQRAATYLDAMRSQQPKGPYYIGGWCAAGPLAVETARQIVASGEDVGYLVLFDSWRPGYAAELAREQAGSPEMSLRARLDRKLRFHKRQWARLSGIQKVQYVGTVIGNKFASVRNRIYLKNWAIAELFCRKFGLTLPHFMHNVSLTTLNSLKEYRGVEPYAGSLTLIRAEEAPYIPGAKEHCGWDAIVKGGVKVLWATGNHESMFLDPHLQKVGQYLREGLAEAYSRRA
jgi:non-ribosomal peptide synthetase component F/thioesterase domain-containing protein/acyl carrier protein